MLVMLALVPELGSPEPMEKQNTGHARLSEAQWQPTRGNQWAQGEILSQKVS